MKYVILSRSFPTNSIDMLDLNAIAIGVSPAYSLEVEHPTGTEYASHLQAIAKHFEIPLREHTDVRRLTKVGDEFRVEMTDDTLRAKHIVWGAGEFTVALFAVHHLVPHPGRVLVF